MFLQGLHVQVDVYTCAHAYKYLHRHFSLRKVAFFYICKTRKSYLRYTPITMNINLEFNENN